LFIILMIAITPGFVFAQKDDDFLYGVAALQQRKYDKAGCYLSNIIRRHPGDPGGYILRGEAYFFNKDYRKALIDFYEADRRKPAIASLWIARTYAQTGEKDKAFQYLEEHLRSVYREPRKKIMLDSLLGNLENTPQWRALWKTDWYGLREKEIAQIMFDLSRENFRAAFAGTELLIAQYSNDPQLLVLRGKIYSTTGETRKAIQDFRDALVIQPADTAALLALAGLNVKKGNYAGAAVMYDKLYGLIPDHFNLLLKSSDAWQQAGQFDKALTSLQNYMKYFPDNLEAVLRAGEISGKLGRYMDALRYYSVVVEKDPGDPLHFIARADMYVKAHTYRYAIDDYAMALDLDPTNGDVYFRRGRAYLKTGNTKNACFDFHRALHYGKKEAIEYLQKYCGY